jgi:hypothetical protein
MDFGLKLKLVKYRDAGLPSYTFFWVDENHKTFGPYFDSEEEAKQWLDNNTKDIK